MTKKLTPAQEFVRRLDAIDAQTPADNSQIKLILREEKIMPGEMLARARAHIKEVRRSLAVDRLATAELARKKEEERLRSSVRNQSHRSLEELRLKLKQLATSLGPGRLAVAHKNLTGGSSREELEELLAEYEHLHAEQTNVKS